MCDAPLKYNHKNDGALTGNASANEDAKHHRKTPTEINSDEISRCVIAEDALSHGCIAQGLKKRRRAKLIKYSRM